MNENVDKFILWLRQKKGRSEQRIERERNTIRE